MQRVATQAIALLLFSGLAAGGVQAGAVPAYITAAIADSARPDSDRARDAQRKPAETLAFAGVKPGDQVLEIAPGTGYYTRLLSAIVGPKGKVTVYLVGPLPKAGATPPPIQAIAADPHYGNVTLIMQRLTEAKPSAAFGLVWTTQNYHDLHNIADLSMLAINNAIFDALKPGGVYFVLDHAAQAGSGVGETNTLHRIEEESVKNEVTSVGFRLAGESNILRNPADPRTGKVFEGEIQGHTDQFILKFRKP
ncbi:MAG: class I SAM-dependent methyltransferase [Proteobacteria bacterium]|nr:class I SAM-dependent methyltransferase [Pseudomonadota bacterium]